MGIGRLLSQEGARPVRKPATPGYEPRALGCLPVLEILSDPPLAQ